MAGPLSYSMEEAREILLDQVITLEDHIYLEGRREEYVRAEDYDRPTILQSCFRYIWSTTHPDWDWEQEELPADTPAAYHTQRDAVYHWFRANARIRGGFKRLPGDVEKTKWTAEDVCGNVYKKAILEWVEAKSGYIPGHADGFLAQYRQARSKLFGCLNADQVGACQRTADQWNGVSVPHHIQVQNFNNKFASVCRAFTNMLVKDYGVFPFLFYVGVPGHNVPAGIYEVMRKEGLAAGTFRSFSKLDSVFRDMKSYVNMNVDVLYRADSKRPPPVRSAEHLKSAEYEFRREDVVGNRVYLFEERVKEGWEENSAHLFYQIIQFCHSILTSSKQTPPPWKALSQDASRLILQICLLGVSIRFGSSPEKTLRDHRNALIKHWFQLGYLEFHCRFSRGGTFSEPDAERWHTLPKYEKDFTEQWLSNERTTRGAGPTASVTKISDITCKFGSGGPRVALPDNSPYSVEEQPERPTTRYRRLPDPRDFHFYTQTSYNPGRPSWPAPQLVAETIYARMQWSSQLLIETGGRAADTLLEGITWLAQLPPVANYDYDMAFFRRQDGKDRSWAIDSLPDWVSWTLDRSYLESQAEVDELARFLRAKAWSFRHDGKTRFAGVQMAWTIALSAILYLRAMRHREEVSVQPPSRWSLSGSPEWQGRAQTYSFALDGEALRAILHEFRCYTEDLVLSMPVTGLPPSLLYVGHLSREEYVLNQIRSVPCLFELFELVVKMPVHGEEAYPSCPVFSGRQVWQQPQLGIPRAAHKEEKTWSVLLATFNNPSLFLRADGAPRGGEAGLSALLELSLVWVETERLFCRSDQLPAYLQSSALTREDETVMKDLLVSAVAEQCVGLRRALQNSDVVGNGKNPGIGAQRARRSLKATAYETGASVYLERHRTDIDAQLKEHQSATDCDSLTSRIRDSTLLEKEREGLWKTNEMQRRDQNSRNFATHRAIHPPKPAAPPLTLPDLGSLHEPLRYSAGLPLTDPPAPKKPGKRAGRAAGSLRKAVRPEASALGSAPVDEASSCADDAEEGPPASGSSSRTKNNPRKRRAEDDPAEDGASAPARWRRRVAFTADGSGSSEDVERRARDDAAGLDENSDDELPVRISGREPKMSGESVAPLDLSTAAGAAELGTATPAVVRTTASASEPGTIGRVEAAAPPDSDPGGHHASQIQRPRPRPQNKDPGRSRKPGISTAF